MTRQRTYGTDTAFEAWVRQNEQLDSRTCGIACHDIDHVWHQYRVVGDRIGERTVQNIMLIEEKSRGGDLRFAQRDTMWLIDQALRFAFRLKMVYRTVRGDRVRVRYFGYFKLRYEGETLESSAWIEWNKRRISLAALTKILRFELDPRTLRPRSERRHHTTHSPLFDA